MYSQNKKRERESSWTHKERAVFKELKIFDV